MLLILTRAQYNEGISLENKDEHKMYRREDSILPATGVIIVCGSPMAVIQNSG